MLSVLSFVTPSWLKVKESIYPLIKTDSSAAEANAKRPGCGTMKHISVNLRNRCYKNRCERRDGLLGEVGEVGGATSKIMQSELASDQEPSENEFRDASIVVVTDAVASVVKAKSSFLETEGGTKQVDKVVKGAHEVGGFFVEAAILCGKVTPCCSTRYAHRDHATKTTLYL